MDLPKEKMTTTTTTTTTGTASTSPATPTTSAAAKSLQEPPPPLLASPAPFSPEWSASLHAFYGRGAVMPQAFYPPPPVAAGQPIVWGAQHVMPPYSSPIPYTSFYPPGGFYAQPLLNAGMSYPIPETEERPPEAKDKHLINKEAPKTEGSPGKSVNATKGSFSEREDVSQSDDSATEGTSDTEDDGPIKEHGTARKRSYGNLVSEGESHPSNSSDAKAKSSYSGRVRTAKKLPVSAPGRAALPSPQSNLNIGMDFWSNSLAGSSLKDERELKRERRKQSNRESARRSRLRRQQECEELAKKVVDLNSENDALRVELERLKKTCRELEAENKAITGELKQPYSSELFSGDVASKPQPDSADDD
ncbi:G-box-binding factor 1-like isoform X1 [Zingiber officinale]|uniref:BZIP domain-containing protein n=1 Tax=Zingiber officinale TaxID=94328 RepID=A0A8J5FVC4_ZINOF|nr:G-box-binding factor 1-like isoform X1 [Zingiber officinale]KAG6492727.1 hypothetical protein ZIOFF_047692 [Zingiber officinale]